MPSFIRNQGIRIPLLGITLRIELFIYYYGILIICCNNSWVFIFVYLIHFFYSQTGCELGSLNQEVFSSSDEEFVGKAALKGIQNTAL